MALVTRFWRICCSRTLSPQTGRENVGAEAERNALLVGLAPTGRADGGGFFVERSAVLVEQELLLLELGREEEVFRQPPQKLDTLAQGGQKGRQGLGGRFQRFQPVADCKQGAAQVVEDVEHHALAGIGLAVSSFVRSATRASSSRASCSVRSKRRANRRQTKTMQPMAKGRS